MIFGYTKKKVFWRVDINCNFIPSFRLFRDRRAPEQKDWYDAYNEMLNRKMPVFIETYGQGELTNPTLILFNKQYSEEAQLEQNAAFQLQQLAIPNGGNPRSSYQSVVSLPKTQFLK